MKIAGLDFGAINNMNTYKQPVTKEGQPETAKPAAEGGPSDKKEQNAPQPGQGELAKAVGQLNDTMEAYSTGLRFELHEKSGEMMVKVINERDDTVIREIPPEKVLDMVAHFKKVLGIIVDKLI
jgi:flagellar protein FlaG